VEIAGGAGGLGWVALKAALLFAVAVIGLRLGERRTLTQLGAFDFAVAVAVGSIIGRTSTASSTSFVTGAVALVTLLVAHRVVSVIRRRSRISRVIDHPPRVLVAGGELQEREMARAGLTDADVFAMLRQKGVDDLNKVGYLLYETRGTTTLVAAGDTPGPLIRDGLAAAGYDGAARPAPGPSPPLARHRIQRELGIIFTGSGFSPSAMCGLGCRTTRPGNAPYMVGRVRVMLQRGWSCHGGNCLALKPDNRG